MSNDDVWFTSDNGFNRPAGSPGAAGNYYESSENIDNIPFADPATPPLGGDFADPNVDYDFSDPNVDYGYDPLGLGPSDGLLEHHQQPGTSNDVGGQFQSMQGMHGNDLYDQRMQGSTVDYNTFERPTVISGNLEYQDLEIVDPNSYFAAHQPSTSQGNEMLINDSYEMIGPSTSYSTQMDHVNPSSMGNSLSQPGTNQQHQQGMIDEPPVPQPPPKSKPKKKAPPKKKPIPAAETTVGNVLSTANKLTQRENNNENSTEKVEMRVSPEDIPIIGRLMGEIQMLKMQEADGFDNAAKIADLEAQIVQVFSKNVTNANTGESKILNQIKSVANTAAPIPAQQQQQQPPPPPKKAAPKKSRSQASKNVQQQPQQNNQPVGIPQAQMTPSKIMMEPPTTTMVPSNSHMNNMYNENGGDNYGSYPSMDEPGTSQQYRDYQQPQSHESMQQTHHQNQGQTQVIHAKVVPSMNQRTHNYRQAVIFSSQNNCEPGPSSQFQQPQSHESHHMEQMPDQQQYHPQDHQRPQSQQMYVPLHHQQEGRMYQHHDDEPTLGDLVRQTQGMYQGEDSPHLRQHLVSTVNATNKQILQRSGAPTPSPGNFYNSNHHQQQYAEPYQNHGSYPASHDMQVHSHSHSQQGYEAPSEASNDFYQGSIQRPNSQMMNVPQETLQQQHYDQRGMYMPADDQQEEMEPESEPEIEYPAPEASEPLSREQLLEKLEEKTKVREEAVKAILLEQKNRLETPDVTPFKSKMDMLERMLPYHHFSIGEEPVANFDSIYQKTMSDAISRADVLGKRIRNIVLRDTMHSEEWERNMLLFMETESERRKLEADRKLAEEDPRAFLQGSEIIRAAKCNQLRIHSVPPKPEHIKDLPDGVLSAVYEEFEFDSYDENRPRGSPLPFFNEIPAWEQESESEPESEQEEEKLPQSEHSSLLGSPLISPVQSTSRLRNESESILHWKVDDDTSLVSPESVKLVQMSGELSCDVFGTKEEFIKPELFPFGRISDAARANEQHRIKQSHPSESLGSSDESTSSEGTPQPMQHQTTETPPRDPMVYATSTIPQQPVPSTSASSFPPVNIRRPMTYDEGSPEIDDDYSMSPPERNVSVEEIPPIPLPVPVHMIKQEKEESSKLKLRVPVAIIQQAAVVNEEEKRAPLKLKLKLKDIKLEEPSPDRELSSHSSKSMNPTSIATPSKMERIVPKSSEKMSAMETPVLKTPLKDLSTTAAESRKRKRSEKIGGSPQQKKTTGEISNSFITPKNGVIPQETTGNGRFLKTMTDGRKLVMKIGRIPNNINHFVTPRRDSKGNMHKDLTATENTRLKMRWFKKDGRLAVEVTEHSPKSQEPSQCQKSNRPSTSSSIVPTPKIPSVTVKARPAPASRKGSVDIAGKDKKVNSVKSKNTFCNRFNPFANVSKPKPSTTPAPTPSETLSTRSMKIAAPVGPSSAPLQQKTPAAPISLTTPKIIEPKVTPNPNTATLTGLIRTTPIVPKITVSNVPAVSDHSSITEKASELNNKANSLLPWLFESSAKPKTVKPQPQPVASYISSIFPSTNQLQVTTEPTEAVALTAQQESPRANSSLSFFEDDKGNGFPFLRSPKRTTEPLPVVEFSDDDEDDLAHSTFSHATDHLLQASKMSKTVNGTTPILPWSNNP